MSYDLYFKPRHGSIDAERFREYFLVRPNYKCEGVQAWYSNEDTGVYFVFEFHEQIEAEEAMDGEGDEHFPLSLNINFFRPSYFILEAEPEVSAFVAQFDLLVSDPQMNGMGEGEYDLEKLISGWSFGNEFGYRAMLQHTGASTERAHLPVDRLKKAWRWNLLRLQLQERIGESKFVPRIMFMSFDGEPKTVAVWPDGIPVVVPKVDYLCVPRKDLAPTRFLRKKEDTTYVAWDVALPLLTKHGQILDDESCSLSYETPPKDVVKFVKALPAESRVVSGLAADAVLDRELYERSVT